MKMDNFTAKPKSQTGPKIGRIAAIKGHLQFAGIDAFFRNSVLHFYSYRLSILPDTASDSSTRNGIFDRILQQSHQYNIYLVFVAIDSIPVCLRIELDKRL